MPVTVASDDRRGQAADERFSGWGQERGPTLPEILGALPRLAGEVSVEDLPALMGRLAEAQAVAMARLMTPGRSGEAATPAGVADQNLPAVEAARRLGVSKEWLYRRGERLPFRIMIGRRVLFSARGLDAWNRQRMGRPDGPP